jgi:hypothetical protein
MLVCKLFETLHSDPDRRHQKRLSGLIETVVSFVRFAIRLVHHMHVPLQLLAVL